MNRDIVQTLRTQEQMYRQMGNVRQGEILARAAEEVDRLRALREAVAKMLAAYKNAEECSCPYCMKDFEAARAEVDRLITEGEG